MKNNYVITYNNNTYNTNTLYLEQVCLKEEFIKKHKDLDEFSDSEKFEPLYEEYNTTMPIIINSLIIADNYEIIEQYYFRKIKIFVYLCYFFCWFFVLVYSYFCYPVYLENFLNFILNWEKYFYYEKIF